MITDEEIKKFLDDIRKTHDNIKEHPYWINFDNVFLYDVLSLFSNTGGLWLVANENKNNPYCILINNIIHDMNYLLSSIRFSINDGSFKDEWKDCMGDVNMVLQVYLQNIHRMIDSYYYTLDKNETVVGYVYYKPKPFPDPLKTGIIKFQVFEREEKKRCYMVLEKNKIPNLIKYLKNIIFIGGSSQEDSKRWINNCLKEIEDGKDIIGDRFKIV